MTCTAEKTRMSYFVQTKYSKRKMSADKNLTQAEVDAKIDLLWRLSEQKRQQRATRQGETKITAMPLTQWPSCAFQSRDFVYSVQDMNDVFNNRVSDRYKSDTQKAKTKRTKQQLCTYLGYTRRWQDIGTDKNIAFYNDKSEQELERMRRLAKEFREALVMRPLTQKQKDKFARLVAEAKDDNNEAINVPETCETFYAGQSQPEVTVCKRKTEQSLAQMQDEKRPEKTSSAEADQYEKEIERLRAETASEQQQLEKSIVQLKQSVNACNQALQRSKQEIQRRDEESPERQRAHREAIVKLQNALQNAQNQLSATQSQLQQKLADLRNAGQLTQQSQQKVQQLRQEVRQVSEQLSSCLSQSRQLKQQQRLDNQAKQDLQRQLSQAADAQRLLNEERKLYEQKSTAQRQQLQKLTAVIEQIDDVKRQCANGGATIAEELQAALNQTEQRTTAKRDSFAKKLAESERHLADIKRKLTSAYENECDCRQKVQLLERQIETRQNTEADLADQANQLESQLIEAQQRNKQLEAKNANNDEVIRDLQQQVDQLLQTVDAQNQESVGAQSVAAQKSQFANESIERNLQLETMVADCNNEKRNLEAKHQKQLAGLQQRVVAATEQVTELTAMNERLRRENQSLKNQLQEKDADMIDLRQERDNFSEAANQLEKSLLQLRAIRGKSSETTEQLQQQILQQEAQIADLQQKADKCAQVGTALMSLVPEENLGEAAALLKSQ